MNKSNYELLLNISNKQKLFEFRITIVIKDCHVDFL